ncbi:MAG: hypothetical protein K9K67_13785 [Bacteriovoracaceae bacterium]|nr:hypothetical protein [Bacteriovoracaceae bacterium]
MSLFHKTLFCFLATSITQIAVANGAEVESPVNKLINEKGIMAKVTKVSMTSDFKEGDSGSFKEFGIGIGHHYFHNKLVDKRHLGTLLETELVLILDKKDILVRVTELDEYHGMSIDALIALPFNFFNPNDQYMETNVNIEEENSVTRGGFKSDKIELTVGATKEITGQELFLRMNRDIKGCLLEKSIYNLSALAFENVEKCRNFKSGVYILSQAGFSDSEIRDIIYELEPSAKEDRVGYIIKDIDWYQRNFDKR